MRCNAGTSRCDSYCNSLRESDLQVEAHWIRDSVTGQESKDDAGIP